MCMCVCLGSGVAYKLLRDGAGEHRVLSRTLQWPKGGMNTRSCTHTLTHNCGL